MKMVRINLKHLKIGFLIILIVLSVIFTRMVLSYDNEEVRIMKMHLTVGETIGFDVATELLEFGKATPLSVIKRTMILSNRNTTKLVHITALGELKDWIGVSENNFIMYPGDSRDLGVKVFAPQDAKKGEYEGKLKIKFTEVEDEV